jgi:hypothetical protein
MANYHSYEPILDSILENNKYRESQKPRIDCPKHGNTLICARCRKCLSCIIDERREWYVQFCKEQRHTFFNLFAPCEFCAKHGDNNMHTSSDSHCSPCWEKNQKEWQERDKYRVKLRY